MIFLGGADDSGSLVVGQGFMEAMEEDLDDEHPGD
jgi:hypothetical protein